MYYIAAWIGNLVYVMNEVEFDNILSSYPEWVSDEVTMAEMPSDWDGGVPEFIDHLDKMVDEDYFRSSLIDGAAYAWPDEELAEYAFKYSHLWEQREELRDLYWSSLEEDLVEEDYDLPF